MQDIPLTRTRTKSISRTSSISSLGKIFQQQNSNRARSVSPSKQLKKSRSSQLYPFMKNNETNLSSTTITSWSSSTTSFQSQLPSPKKEKVTRLLKSDSLSNPHC